MKILNANKIVGAIASAAILGSTAVAAGAVSPVDAPGDGAVPGTGGIEVDQEQAVQLVSVSNVSGSFGFGQDAETPNVDIKDVFQKSAAAACNVLVPSEEGAAEIELSVDGDVPSPYTATLSQLAEENGPVEQIMGCACTANAAGGWAVANARVSGVSIDTLAELAGVSVTDLA